jgi:hypothetical protein
MKPSQGMLLAAVLLPVVCGAEPPKYQEPVDEPSAKLRIVTPRPALYSVHVTAVDTARCKSIATIGWVSGGAKLDQNRVGMLGSTPPANGVLERRVRAGSPVAIAPTFIVAMLKAKDWLVFPFTAGQHMIGKKQSGACRTPIFVPEAGAEYELTIEPSPGACAVKLEQLSADESGTLLRTEIAVPEDQFTSAPPLKCPKLTGS